MTDARLAMRCTAAIGLTMLALCMAQVGPPEGSQARSFVVQGGEPDGLADLVQRVGGTVTHELGVIEGVAATLTIDQIEAAKRLDPRARFFQDASITTADGIDDYWPGIDLSDDSDEPSHWLDAFSELSSLWSVDYLQLLVRAFGDIEASSYTHYPALVTADSLHEAGIRGAGVTIAVVDTGFMAYDDLARDSEGDYRLLAQYDAILDDERIDDDAFELTDLNGHGGHVASVAVNSERSTDGRFNGVAPDAGLVIVKAFDADGAGCYSDIIRGIEWVIDNRDRFGVRVLNLSFSGPVLSRYWGDPLNQAVMAAWQAGIVVVASAGNLGPDPMTVGVPGNVPYVITVGAMTDGYTPGDPGDDRLATFSAAGPTTEGFVKPDLLAPGGHLVAQMSLFSTLALQHPEFHDGGLYFMMSGTSQATAVVSGVVALLLQMEPALTPDEVKARLMTTARPALRLDGATTYSVFQQGAGLIDSVAATSPSASPGEANLGLDVDLDLAGEAHYIGPARQAPDGTFYIEGSATTDGFIWSDISALTDGFIWSDISAVLDGFVWSDISSWTTGFIWGDISDLPGQESDELPLDTPMAVNVWVEQE